MSINVSQNELSSTALMEKGLVDEFYPIRAPLSAKYKRTFGHKTIGFRLPVILTKIIDQLSRDKDEIQEKYGPDARAEIKDVVGRLAKLKNELQTNKPIARVDSPVWNDYILQVAKRHHHNIETNVTYYFSPWLFVECYIYHRVHQAFHSTIHLKDFDYVRKQKQENFVECLEQACVLAEYSLSSKTTSKALQSLLEVALWGNQCDLSLSSGESNSQSIHLLDSLQELSKLILCDNSELVWKALKNDKQPSDKSIGYILDNAGFELFTDLCFADLLLSEVDRVDFYVKEIPWFVSDAMVPDFEYLVETMAESDRPNLQQLGQKWKTYLATNRWRIVNHPFWTLPHSFNEMESCDPELYSRLSKYDLLIFKGDLNYRKLVGDVNWEPETPFKEALHGFLPAPLVALRTCKADTVAGLKPGIAEEMSIQDPTWLTTGKYGLIQFTS